MYVWSKHVVYSRFGYTESTCKQCFQLVAKKQFSTQNYLPENDVILVRDVIIPDLFVYEMTVDSFPPGIRQGLGGANHT